MVRDKNRSINYLFLFSSFEQFRNAFVEVWFISPGFGIDWDFVGR